MIFHRKFRSSHPFKQESGFSLVEIVIAIVVIGVTVPAIMTAFQGLEGTKTPEFVIQASFIAQKKTEELASQNRLTIITSCPDGVTTALPPDGDYAMTCLSEQVNATDPDTSTASTFARKITLTVNRTDGAMDAMQFSTMFALDE